MMMKNTLKIVLAGLSLNAALVQASGVKLYSYADIAEETIPGVVNIRTKTYVRKASGQDLYQFFLDGRIPQSNSSTSVGSGVVIDSSGLIVTNYHVVEDADRIEVLFAKSMEKVLGTIIGVDTKTDLALIRVKAKGSFNPLSMGDSDTLRIGDGVLAIGNPFGYSHTVTSGIISAKGRVIGTGPYDSFLQTDAPIHPGNSGGPLLDTRGRMIGINTAVSAQGYGIGFAIPVNLVKIVVEDLKKYGKVRRPWMGIIGKNILSLEDIKADPGGDSVYGIIVSNLIIDGPANQAGIQIGDLITKADDQKITDLFQLQRWLASKKIPDSVRLQVYRRGKGFLQVKIMLDEMPANKDLPKDSDLF